MKTINRKIISVILFLAGTVCAFALDINGYAPTFTGSNPTVVDAFNTVVNDAFNKALGDIRKEAGNIDTKPEKFITSWGNASVFASSGAATQRAYGDYKIFCFTLGPVFGLQFPYDLFQITDELGDLTQKLNDDHDIKLGLSPQIINARIGINTSKFLLKNLYLGLHIGYFNLKGDELGLDGFSFNTFSIGATANYQLVPSIKIATGVLLWRGVNVGSGFLYSGTKIGYSMNLEQQKQSFSDTTNGIFGELTIDPKIILDMQIDTFTVPIEVTTAVKLLWFLNIPFGVGVDFGFGKSDMKVGMEGDINVTGLSGVSQSKPGNLSVTAGGDMPPFPANLKLMTGVGLNIGPVLIDIPVTFYLDNGYSVGFSVGAVW